jgi:hypothetical protein
MVSKQVIAGEFCHHDEPNWQPLYDLVGVKLADWFMWMGASDLEDGLQVHSYKHITTRGHLHLVRTAGRSSTYRAIAIARSTGGQPSTSCSMDGRSWRAARTTRTDSR